MMNKLLYIIMCVCICSCGMTDIPEDIGEKPITENMSYYKTDTIKLNIRLDKLPYVDDNVKIYSDSCYFSNSSVKTNNDRVLVYKNACIFVEILNQYRIEDIDWGDSEMWKTIEITHMPTRRVYWCGGDLYLDSVNIILTKKELKVTCG